MCPPRVSRGPLQVAHQRRNVLSMGRDPPGGVESGNGTRLAGVFTWKSSSGWFGITPKLSKLLPSPVACSVCWIAQKLPHATLVSSGCGLFAAHIHALANPAMIDLALVRHCVFPSDFYLAKLASQHLQTPGIGSPLSPFLVRHPGLRVARSVRLSHLTVGYSFTSHTRAGSQAVTAEPGFSLWCLVA